MFSYYFIINKSFELFTSTIILFIANYFKQFCFVLVYEIHESKRHFNINRNGSKLGLYETAIEVYCEYFSKAC